MTMEDTGTVTVVDPGWPSPTAYLAQTAHGAQVPDEVTAVVGKPRPVADLYAPPSDTLVSDCEAMLASYRRAQVQRPAWAVALGHASLPAPVVQPTILERAFRSLRTGAQWLARVAHGSSELTKSTARAVVQSDLVRRILTRRCHHCKAPSVRHVLAFVVGAPPQVVADAIQGRRWDVLLHRPDGAHGSSVSIRITRCNHCPQTRRADVIVGSSNGSEQLMARDIELSNEELYYVLSLGPE